MGFRRGLGWLKDACQWQRLFINETDEMINMMHWKGIGERWSSL
jgi:hypothetical protein